MGRTLLIGSPATTWREWEKSHRASRDWLCLDPCDPNHGTPAKLTLWQGDKPAAWSFYGSLDPGRFPQVLLCAAAQLLACASTDVVVQLFAYRPSPVLRHIALLLAQLIQPSEILIAKGTEIDRDGWPVGPDEVAADNALPLLVQGAQRKAHWLKLLEDCEPHEVDLDQIAIEGSRLGSGTVLTRSQLDKVGMGDVWHGEVCGGALLLVAPANIEEDAMARALSVFHATRAQIVEPDAYDGLLCSFARQSGEDFGMGLIERMDFGARTLRARCTAVPKAPVRIVKIGALRLDAQGRELGEVRPWQV